MDSANVPGPETSLGPSISAEGLGWNDWFQQRLTLESGLTVARVACVDRGQYLLADTSGTFRAKLSGSFQYANPEPDRQPCVGDWVAIHRYPDGFAAVHTVLERKTFLRRKSAGASSAPQMIAANIDCVIVVQSCHFDFNLKRLERYLVMVAEGRADAFVLLTKTDLVTPPDLATLVSKIRSAGIHAPILPVSNLTGDGLDALRQVLQPRKTYCFVGSSGVGKSTLLNQLLGTGKLRTQTVSDNGEGRHTTVRRELHCLGNGALVIDNPGMREFGILNATDAFSSGFAAITELAASCRYRDCGHTSEPGCAVLAALDSGALDNETYENFLKLRAESRFHELTQIERRKKDRDFGRFIKSAKKDLREQ